MSFLIGQKFVENVKIEKLKNAIFWVIFKHYDCTGKMWNAKKIRQNKCLRNEMLEVHLCNWADIYRVAKWILASLHSVLLLALHSASAAAVIVGRVAMKIILACFLVSCGTHLPSGVGDGETSFLPSCRLQEAVSPSILVQIHFLVSPIKILLFQEHLINIWSTFFIITIE